MNYFKSHRSGVLASLGAAAILLYYFARIFRGRDLYELLFNSMALYLLQGRFDVDPATVGPEAFVRDGHSYAYFGVFPALLRLFLVPFFDINALPLARVYTCLALSLGAFAQVASVMMVTRLVPQGAGREAIQPRLVLLALLSGPPILIGLSATVFDEAIGWAWSQASVFVAVLLCGLTRSQGFTTGLLAAMAVLAGLALHTRVTTALGLYAALGFVMLSLLFQREAAKRPRMNLLLARVLQPRILVPAMILATFAVGAGWVNFARWGDPFTFADIRRQEHLLSLYPDRLARLETYGLFHLNRLGYGLVYYFFPVWPLAAGDGGLLFEKRILELFDVFELPPSSFFLSEPLSMLLALIGLIAIVRRRIGVIPRGPLIGALAGLAIPPALMLSAWSMAFRYRLEFMPLVTLLSSIGGLTWLRWTEKAPQNRVKHAGHLFLALFLLQIVSAHVYSYLYLLSHFGESLPRVQGGIIAYYRDQIAHYLALP